MKIESDPSVPRDEMRFVSAGQVVRIVNLKVETPMIKVFESGVDDGAVSVGVSGTCVELEVVEAEGKRASLRLSTEDAVRVARVLIHTAGIAESL